MKNFTIFDNSKYQPGLCSNGGYYAFWQTYDWVAGEEGKPGHYDKQFYTTRTRGLCPSCGQLYQSPKDYEVHSTCTSQVTIEEALSDLLTVVSRLKERADYFDGPAFRITVSE